jgi:cytochrome c peroxidase
MRYSIIVSLAIFLSCSSCRKENTFNDCNPTPYTIETPAGFPQMAIPDFNPTTEEGVALGRKLYYDPILSMNGNSCSSCHYQQISFSVPGIGPTGHSILPHVNLGWNPDFDWIGDATQLDYVALGDLAEGNVFLNANNDSIRVRLQKHSEYPELFCKAFCVDIADASVDDRQHYISYALAQFLRTLVSCNSRFDKYSRHELQLTPQEINGYIIFNTEKGDCFHCHGSALFTDNLFRNNGVDSVFEGNNSGRFIFTNDSNDIGKFSSPTLRNIELTSPYMHDGRFNTLEEVVEFYNSGVKKSPTVDPIMTKPGKEFGLQLSEQDKADLVAFLKTLTDSLFITNPDFAAP